MDFLVFRTSDAHESQAAYDNICEIFGEEPQAQIYFDKQWKPYLHLWMAQYRNGGDSTNNGRIAFQAIEVFLLFGQKNI